ncbi:unnamed protein product [Rotaria sp. Silwood2]|nr:unnamed protein product [Rotaria sp. Silwood2]CAF3267272.1 unnamed protein product [Rotaria sp. Silwood2]CAF3400236.1 unnamed protein product [Rotaria sp. Silwood2]CAF3906527.1 unnamed protein product [Rotaria sp. Silwood2]CAF4351954.1 unnamed protein product [Rotaria sp. Silwood2]
MRLSQYLACWQSNDFWSIFLVATSTSSRINILTDDDDDKILNEELLQTENLSNDEDDKQTHHDSEISSITNLTSNPTSSEFNLSTRTSSHSSDINVPISSLSMVAISSKQALASSLINTDVNNEKSKKGVKHFLRKIFGSSSASNALHHHETKSKYVDSHNIHSRAYSLPITQGPIRLFILRHGERLDRYYSSQWLRQAFDKDGNFCRFSPILPETLPVRASIGNFDLDPPLTYNGLKDAYRTGAALKEKNLAVHYCYSSPALRCVQTATKMLEGLQLNNKIKIRIEPGLFECTAWYIPNEKSNVLTMPQFMTKTELLENKYPIDKNYREQMNIAEISQLETELEFYERSHTVTSTILKIHENEFITQIQQEQLTPQQHMHILFIAHAPTLETCTRKLCGGRFRPSLLANVIRNVDYLTMTVIEKTDNNCDKWIFRRNSFYGDEF